MVCTGHLSEITYSPRRQAKKSSQSPTYTTLKSNMFDGKTIIFHRKTTLVHGDTRLFRANHIPWGVSHYLNPFLTNVLESQPRNDS